jgi:FtsH-binding integral membrane protein
MSEQIQNFNYADTGSVTSERNKVLKNTYWLLALTLLPYMTICWTSLVHL